MKDLEGLRNEKATFDVWEVRPNSWSGMRITFEADSAFRGAVFADVHADGSLTLRTPSKGAAFYDCATLSAILAWCDRIRQKYLDGSTDDQ